jgi:membrane protease YdiL (CAAX protease family)
MLIHEVWDLLHKHPTPVIKPRPKSKILLQRIGKINKEFFIHFFVVVTIELALVSVFSKVHGTYFPNLDVYSHTFAWVYLTVVALPMIYLIYRHHIPATSLGIRYQNAVKSSMQSLLITSVMVFALCLYKDWDINDLARFFFTPWAAVYLLHSYIQELIARGMLQGMLCRLMTNYHPIYPIALASMIFSLFHLQFGLLAVALTFLSGLVLGTIYQQQKNLMGVTLMHFILGWIAFSSGML